MTLKHALPLMLAALLLCSMTQVSAQQTEHKYAMAVFHFNVQYVAGGLVGFLPVVLPDWEQSLEENEDMIILESFDPVLDLYLEHPEWGVNLEMQSYMIEVMAERHPGVLNKLRTLAQRGQAEVVSFHYSDQLFLAYPRRDWEKSMEMTKRIFEEQNIPHARSVFCQEGQSGVGMAEAMAQSEQDVMIWPKNLFKYNLGDDYEVAPYYEFGDIHMVVGARGVDYEDESRIIKTNWTFFDDGELLATGDWDPYFPGVFKVDQEALDEYEDKLAGLEAEGYDIATVSEYVDDLKVMEFPPTELPQLLDGTWQPQVSTLLRWMGGSALWGYYERDNHVRTLCAAAHREMVGAETVLNAISEEELDAEGLDTALEEAWRLLMLGQVTDATGINPFQGEVHYGLAHCGETMRMAREIIERGGAILGAEEMSIDTKTGDITKPEEPEELVEVEPAWDLQTEGDDREVEQKWYLLNNDPKIHRIEVTYSPGVKVDNRSLRAKFAGATDKIIYCPGLMDNEPVTFTRRDVAWDEYPMALANGMIGLADDLFVIKDQGYTHVVANLVRHGYDVEFMDDTAPWSEEIQWVFYLLRGTPQQAVAFANSINVTPTLTRSAKGAE